MTLNPPTSTGSYARLVASDGHVFRAYVTPAASPPKAAVVLLQIMDQRHPAGPGARVRTTSSHPDGFGVNHFARQMAARFAQAGYVVVAPSTFGRGKVGEDYGYRYIDFPWDPRLALPLQPLASEAVLLNVGAAIDYASGLTTTGKVALVGYCWGGLLAWQAASQFTSVSAAACHYGGGMETLKERSRRPRCPVMVHWPSDARWTSPEGIEAFVAQHDAATDAAAVVSHHYPARYGFMQPTKREYDATAAEVAHERTLDFLARQLGLNP